MEVTWYGRTCIRLRGKDAVVVADPYQAVVGPTGRGITGEIVTYSHPDATPLPQREGNGTRSGGGRAEAARCRGMGRPPCPARSRTHSSSTDRASTRSGTSL